MRWLLLAAALTLSPGLAVAHECRSSASNIEAIDCARHNYLHTDEELNRLWKILKPAADAAGWGQRLLQEQRAWLKRRDARCEPELNSGGSGAPLFFAICLDEETEARNAEFRRMLQ